ncbi:sensor histidine kinase [Paludibacterium denitrificans]|uniref:histidine kinase n=1 Tax=Paludibacterium denitrificans TaxID=2675226 RepID=A0A844G8G4_9NEIS|nr:sensor histidine kinase [Paludibacterium denitrificans]MTD32676.1 histidine kinase [Paludibacterium denitrificans]
MTIYKLTNPLNFNIKKIIFFSEEKYATIKQLIFIALSIILLNQYSIAQTIITSKGKINLGNSWEMLYDPQGLMTLEEIEKPEIKNKFIAQKSAPSLGYRTGATWLRFNVLRPKNTSAEWWLELQSPMLDEATLYFPENNGTYIKKTIGDQATWKQRDLDYRNPVFRLVLPENTPTKFYVRVRGKNNLAIGLTLWSPISFVSALTKEQLGFGTFFAINLVLILINIWFFQATKDRSYALLSLFTITNLITTLGSEGYLYQYILRDQPDKNEFIMMLAMLLGPPTGAMFQFSYMRLSQRPEKKWTKTIIGMTWAVALLSLFLLFGMDQQWVRPFYQGWTFLCLVGLLLFVLKLAYKGSPEARIMLYAMLTFWIGVSLRIGRNLGILPPGYITDNAYYIGMAVYLLVLNYAVTRQIQRIQKEKQLAKIEALESAKRVERELEDRVVQRTRELQNAMEQVEASLKLERRAKIEQQDFFATVSHELRTPLAVIDITAQNLEFDANNVDEETRGRFRKILKSTERLSLLLDDYLNEHRFALLRHGTNLAPCNLRHLLKDAASSAEILTDGHVFEIEAEDLPENFICDQDLTKLVLRSLADNAVKYTPPGSTIRFNGQQVKNGIKLNVIDSGQGIEKELLEKIFEPYFRASNDQRQPGTGLGLALARRMIEVQRGTLTVTSTPGEGCCFSIFLPSISE